MLNPVLAKPNLAQANIEDWLALYEIVEHSGDKLKSTSGWGADANRTDDFGFSAIPVGGSQGNDYFYDAGELATFWLAQEDNGKFGTISLLSDRSQIYQSSSADNYGFSVRCVKD